jgi:ArsR family transcriptional regulator
MKRLIRVLKALGDPNRMRIVKMLMHREMCVCELAEALGVTQPSVSRHMKLLEDADLVQHQREGQWINYRLHEGPENPYSRVLLEDLQNWLEDDPEIRSLIRKASTLDREVVCRRGPPRPKKALAKDRTREQVKIR